MEEKERMNSLNLNFIGKLPPFQRFIKGKTDVNNVYESLQIQNLSLEEAGGASE
jgi:hypothetical protein